MAHKRRKDYVPNRPPSCLAGLPRSTTELKIAYRIYGPGFCNVEGLRITASELMNSSSESSRDRLRGIMGDLGYDRHSWNEFYDLTVKSKALYEKEILRMEEADQKHAIMLEEQKAAEEVRKAARDKNRSLSAKAEALATSLEEPWGSQNEDARNNKKRRVEVEDISTTSSVKRRRIDHGMASADKTSLRNKPCDQDQESKKVKEIQEVRDGLLITVMVIEDDSDDED